MHIPSRAEVDAYCGVRTTLYQRVAGILAPALLIGAVAFVLLRWRSLPEQIPTHYDFSGEVTGYGGRGVLLVMPIIGLVTDLVVALVGRFPQSWNTGVRLTVINRARIYRLTRDLMADLRLALALLFGGFGVYLSLLPGHFPAWFSALIALLIIVPILRYFVRARRAR